MQADEKKCPQCAETIKVEATKCRFCGKQFDYKEIGIAKYRDNASPRERQIDQAIAAAMGLEVDSLYIMRDFKKWPKDEDFINTTASRSTFSPDEIADRLMGLDIAVQRGTKISEDELERHRREWSASEAEKASGPLTLDYCLELMDRYGQTWFTTELVNEMAPKVGVSKRQFEEAAKAHGFVYLVDDGSLRWPRELRQKIPLGPNRGPVPEASNVDPSSTQYGVLQPAANAAAGCFTAWQWVILIFLILLVAAAIKAMF